MNRVATGLIDGVVRDFHAVASSMQRDADRRIVVDQIVEQSPAEAVAGTSGVDTDLVRIDDVAPQRRGVRADSDQIAIDSIADGVSATEIKALGVAIDAVGLHRRIACLNPDGKRRRLLPVDLVVLHKDVVVNVDAFLEVVEHDITENLRRESSYPLQLPTMPNECPNTRLSRATPSDPSSKIP